LPEAGEWHRPIVFYSLSTFGGERARVRMFFSILIETWYESPIISLKQKCINSSFPSALILPLRRFFYLGFYP
jgi:hypothetical protein